MENSFKRLFLEVFLKNIMFTYESNILLHDKLPETVKHVFSGSLNGDNFLIQSWEIYLE